MRTDPQSVWEEFQKGMDYQQKMGFSKSWPEFTNFIEGKQWPTPTEKTKYMPRPVINQCDFIIDNKLSNILSQSIKMVYSPEEQPEGVDISDITKQAENFTDAAQSVWNDIDQDQLNNDTVYDTLSLGTGIYHYFWDNSITGGKLIPYVGKIQGENIDPMDIVLGNPQLKHTQTQKQPFIIIRGKEDTATLKEIAKENGDNADLIVPDDRDETEKYDNAQKDMDGAKKTTVLTKYYKEKGQVYWIRVTKSATVQKVTPLAPEGRKPFKLYPIEILVFKPRRKCTFGRSIIEDIIPNQKALNWGLGMMLLSIQQTAWPKIIAKMGALMQSLTNEPGEIITDHFSVPGIDGVKYMQPPNFSQMPMLLTDKLLEMTRQVTGTTEVNSGEVMGANMAAAAIIALQNQAKKPNENYTNMLIRSMKNIGRIEEEFFKVYYNMPRPIQSTDDQGNEITKTFTGTESKDTSFGLKIDVGPSSVFSESLQMNVLQTMHDKGDLDKYQFVKYIPQNIVPQELKHDFEKEYEQIQEQQKMQAEMQGHASNIMGAFNPQEQQILSENPQMVHNAVNQVMGGAQGGM